MVQSGLELLTLELVSAVITSVCHTALPYSLFNCSLSMCDMLVMLWLRGFCKPEGMAVPLSYTDSQ